MGKVKDVAKNHKFNIMIIISQQNHLGLACILKVWVI